MNVRGKGLSSMLQEKRKKIDQFNSLILKTMGERKKIIQEIMESKSHLRHENNHHEKPSWPRFRDYHPQREFELFSHLTSVHKSMDPLEWLAFSLMMETQAKGVKETQGTKDALRGYPSWYRGDHLNKKAHGVIPFKNDEENENKNENENEDKNENDAHWISLQMNPLLLFFTSPHQYEEKKNLFLPELNLILGDLIP
jgi:hypothetical protein